MPYAIIRTGGKQYRVSEGQCLKIEKLEAEVGQEVALADILALGEGESLQMDAKVLGPIAVQARVVRHGRGPKILVSTYKRRKGFERRHGHRQDFTEIQIVSIPAAQA
jgi:large subunit ribosomal protein L21